jgi:hypothetical protein
VDHTDINKAEVYDFSKFPLYNKNSLEMKCIMNKITGSICAFSFGSERLFKGKLIPFDTYIQCIEGIAEIVIDDNAKLIQKGQFIIIPAHSQFFIKIQKRFKMLSVIIKSGYEDVS